LISRRTTTSFCCASAKKRLRQRRFNGLHLLDLAAHDDLLLLLAARFSRTPRSP
jgi:hypothetical protein